MKKIYPLLLAFAFSTLFFLSSCEKEDENKEDEKKPCEENNTGNFCFKNNSSIALDVKVFDSSTSGTPKRLTLNVGQTQCFYDLSAKALTYQAWDSPGSNWGSKYAEGQFLVVQCETDTFVIN
jgi:hypothetical protein